MKFLLTIAGLGGLLYGVDFGVIATAEPYLKALNSFTDGEIGFIVGAVLLGGIVSTLVAGFLCERFGRKPIITFASVLFLIAMPIVCLGIGSFGLLVVGRFLQGMSAGLISVVLPMFMTESLPADYRGRGTGVFQFCLGLGLVVASAVGYVVAYGFGSADQLNLATASKIAAWQANFWWTTVPVAALLIGSLFLKESPVWLARRNSNQVIETKEKFHPVPQTDSILSRRYLLPFCLALFVLILNKTTGTSTFTSYLVSIFHKSGFDGLWGNVGQFAIKLTNLFVTLVAAALVDRKGRTALLKIGTFGMTVGLLAVAFVFTAIERFGVAPTRLTGFITLVGFFVMQVFYALGPGLCVWLVLSELMPLRIRAHGMALALFANQLVAWGLASVFRVWITAWGWDTMFYFFAANAILYFIVVLFIPETKGKSLEELEHLFERKKQ